MLKASLTSNQVSKARAHHSQPKPILYLAWHIQVIYPLRPKGEGIEKYKRFTWYRPINTIIKVLYKLLPQELSLCFEKKCHLFKDDLLFHYISN